MIAPCFQYSHRLAHDYKAEVRDNEQNLNGIKPMMSLSFQGLPKQYYFCLVLSVPPEV